MICVLLKHTYVHVAKTGYFNLLIFYNRVEIVNHRENVNERLTWNCVVKETCYHSAHKIGIIMTIIRSRTLFPGRKK